MQRNLPCA